jgi:hypothetical protein
MSLLCAETEKECSGKKKIYAVSHALGEGYAVGQVPINKIPQTARLPKPVSKMDDGYNICEGVSTVGLSGNWQSSTFERGKFLFAISEETALKYLPNTIARIRESIRENAS